MGRSAGLAALAACVMVTACSGDTDSSQDAAKPALLTAAALGEQTVLSVDEYLAEPPYASADRENGERQAQICRACHSFDAGGPDMIGPGLHGFFGREAGAVAGFDYSSAILDVDFVWTPRALDAWLQQPGRFLPGNRMAFAGVGKPQDRADLIAYLLEATAPQ